MAYKITVYISVNPNMRRTLRQAGKNMSLIHFHTMEFLTKTLSIIEVHSACLNRTMYFRLGELRMTQR